MKKAKPDVLRGSPTGFASGWPKNKNQDPRGIAAVWKDRGPYQMRTADGTFAMPKGMGQKNRGALTKDKPAARTYTERERSNVAGFQRGAKNGGR